MKNLSRRQEQIRDLVLSGVLHVSDMAKAMGVCESTIKMQLGRMYIKYGVCSFVEMLREILRGASDEELQSFLGR